MITRFAPSPTGPLHLGHAYSAILAHDMARTSGGQFFLRIEDIDRQRSKPEWETLLVEDLRWLGLSWDGPIVRQSDRLSRYQAALENLWQQGLLFPCHCSRKDIQAALEAPQENGFPIGPDGFVYPGTCRAKNARTGKLPAEQALRLDCAKALSCHEFSTMNFHETGLREANTDMTFNDFVTKVGDIVLSRRDFLGSYHLSVVLDDADQMISHVVRGEDLFEATQIHVVLQRILGLPTPIYHHHKLIRDDAGKRLAKRDDARALFKYRREGASPQDIRRMVGLSDN